MKTSNELLARTLRLTEAMAELADLGDAARQDVGCGVLYGLLRDSAFKIRKLAEQEIENHAGKGMAAYKKNTSRKQLSDTVRPIEANRSKSHKEGKMQPKEIAQTEMNLLQAFAGESQANRKYLAFAKQAEKEGYPQIARLFRAVAEAETVHALSHFRTLEKVGTTEENLKAALAGETFEFTEMYPPMMKRAEEEGHPAALRSFTYANSVEIKHASLYQQALDLMGALKETDYYVCSVCGYTCADEPPGTCPVCGSAAKVFSKTE